MRRNLKKYLGMIALITALVLILSSAAMAVAPTPKYVYYQNADSEWVRADYAQAIDDLFENDTTLRDAIREKIIYALENSKLVYIEDIDGLVLNYSLAQGPPHFKTYYEAWLDPDTFEVFPPPVPVKELVVIGGVAVERSIIEGDSINVSTASELRNALGDEYRVINLISDITITAPVPPVYVDYEVTINLQNYKLTLNGVNFVVNAQGVVITAGAGGGIVGVNGDEEVIAEDGAEVTYQGTNPGIIEFDNIELVIDGGSTVNLQNAAFIGADDDIIPVYIYSNSELNIEESTYDVEVKADAVLQFIGININGNGTAKPKLTGDGRIFGSGAIFIDGRYNAFDLNIAGNNSANRLTFAVSRIDIVYEEDIQLQLADLTLNNPVWLDNAGDNFNYDQYGVKVFGDLNGSGIIRGREGALYALERVTVIQSSAIDGITLQQLRLDINYDDNSAITATFSGVTPVTLAGNLDVYIANSQALTPNRLIASGTVDVPGDVTFIFDNESGTAGSSGNIEGLGSFVGSGKITYDEGTNIKVHGNSWLTFDVNQYVYEDIEFANLRLLKTVYLDECDISVTGDLEGGSGSYDEGKIIGVGPAVSSVTTNQASTLEYLNLENLTFNIDSPTGYLGSAFSSNLVADISSTLTVEDLNILGTDVYVGGTGTFTGNRVYGQNSINFDDSAGLTVQGNSWFTFEVPISLYDDISFANLEFKEVIYEVDDITIYVLDDLIAWKDEQGNIHGVIDGRNYISGEAMLIEGNADEDTTLYNLTLNNLDYFEVVDRRVFIKNQLGTTKHYPGQTGIGMDVRGDTNHEIYFFVNGNTSLIIDNAVKMVQEAVDLYYGGGDEDKPGAVRGQNGPAVIRSAGNNPITVAEGSRLLFMGHHNTNLVIDARLDIEDVDRVKMGIIDLMRRVTNKAGNDLIIFPNKVVSLHDNLVLEADLAILTDMGADRPIISVESYDEIIGDIEDPVQGTIRGTADNADNRITGPFTLTLGNRLKLDNVILDSDLDSVNVQTADLEGSRKVITLKDVVIEALFINFEDYLVVLNSDLELKKADSAYPSLLFRTAAGTSDDIISILDGNGYSIKGQGGIAFRGRSEKAAVARNVTFDLVTTGFGNFPEEIVIRGSSGEKVIFENTGWAVDTTVQVGYAPWNQYPTLEFTGTNDNQGYLYVWQVGGTDEKGITGVSNLVNQDRIDYYNK